MAAITHHINEPWRTHLAECIKAIQQHQSEAQSLTKHISLTCGIIAKEAGLPETLTLSADGTTLMGESQ